MKNILILVVLALAGCNSPHTKTPATPASASAAGNANRGSTHQPAAGTNGMPAGTATPAGDPGTTAHPSHAAGNDPYNASSVNPGAGTVVFVGVFARWDYPGGGQFDGSYDSVNNLFVMCENHRCQKVPRSQITFQQFGHCDTALKDRIMIFEKLDSGQFHHMGSGIRITGNKAIMGAGSAVREIQLDTPAIRRIQQAYKAKPAAILQPPRSSHTAPATIRETNIVRPRILPDTINRPRIRKATTNKPALRNF